MRTLDRWRPYLSTPRTISFSRLELIGRDFTPPMVVGTGEVSLPSVDRIEYAFKGLPEDPGRLLSALYAQQRRPYDDLTHFRLVGTDAEGIEWNLGWTAPQIEPTTELWTFRGVLNGICPSDGSDTVSADSSTELIFVLPVDHRIALTMQRLDFGKQAREHVLQVLGSAIHFSFEPSSHALSITATHTETLPPTYTENWLGEPLRILFGQLVYPRLVARNLGKGRTHIFIRPVPALIARLGWAALWPADRTGRASDELWRRYTDLLTLIAGARDANGHPNFEGHKITRLYEELIQASTGSRWVWALTFASTIEALVKMLIPKATLRADVDLEAVDKFVQHIRAWSGSDDLKEVAIAAARRTTEVTPLRKMHELRRKTVITKDQIDSWQTIRNSVMHGSLVSPYSTQEEDARLLNLAAMVHALTFEVLRCSTNNK